MLLSHASETYIFNGSYLNILTDMGVRKTESIIYTNTKNNIYLGKFIKSQPIVWRNNETVMNGLFIFENGSIAFPDYRYIQIDIDNLLNKGNDNNKFTRNDDNMLNYQDIYL